MTKGHDIMQLGSRLLYKVKIFPIIITCVLERQNLHLGCKTLFDPVNKITSEQGLINPKSTGLFSPCAALGERERGVSTPSVKLDPDVLES